jgi:two-component system phosphate regulon sensor histidine kinase PhoR
LGQSVSDGRADNFQLSLDTIPLGIQMQDVLVARFDSSQIGAFRHLRKMLILSFVVILLVIFSLVFLTKTIWVQWKTAVEKEDAVASIVHDLRAPVNFTKSTLPDINADEASQLHLKRICYKIEQMSLMIENMMVASIAEETLRFELVPVLLYKYLADIVDKYQFFNENRHFSFSCDDTTIEARIDKAYLEKAVINLIENAIKYSEVNSEICISCYEKNLTVYITVKDQGIGISEQYHHHLFEKYYRVPQKDSLDTNGFGLGLYSVKFTAQKHGGDVTVRSEVKKGSEFTIRIPAAV